MRTATDSFIARRSCPNWLVFRGVRSTKIRSIHRDLVASHSHAHSQPPTLQPRQSSSLSVFKQLLRGIAVASAAVALAASHAHSAAAITTEQLLFLEAWRAVDRAYVDKTFNGQNWFKVREDALRKVAMEDRRDTYSAIRGMLNSLDDPFTTFLDPTRYSALKRGTSGNITGVGLEVAFDTEGSGELVVVSPAPGGPAELGGVRPGETIATINGTPTKGLTLYDAADLLQGPEGTQVQLGLRRGSAVAPVDLTRQKIVFNPVSWKLCGRSGSSSSGVNTGYIRVAAFTKQTTANVETALDALKAAGAQSFVLDLRNNFGGYFPSSVELAGMWIDKGTVVLIADGTGVRDVIDAPGRATLPDAPLSVLVNRGTASASEVLAGALKDNKRALIFGDRTFGKGLIQTVVPLSDGSAVTVTVARYQTPLGKDINKVGVTPDYPLDVDLPTQGDAFCSVLQSGQAPRLFR